MFNYSLQESCSPSMSLLSSFHSHCMVIASMVIGIVTYLFFMTMTMKLSNLYSRKFSSSELLEVVWTLIPCVILTTLAIPSLEILYLAEEFSHPFESVKVVGHQWYWTYEIESESGHEVLLSYMLPSIIVESGEFRLLETTTSLLLPVKESVRVIVSSTDVIHSWTVPSMGVKVDAVPGRLNSVSFTPLKAGVFYGQCSEICGSLHSFMPIKIQVLSMKDFLKLS